MDGDPKLGVLIVMYHIVSERTVEITRLSTVMEDASINRSRGRTNMTAEGLTLLKL